MRRSWLFAVTVLGCLLIAPQAWPQGASAQTRDTTQAAVAPIAEPEIPRQAVQALSRFASLRGRLAPDSSIVAIGAELPSFVASMPEHLSDSALATLSLFQLDPLRDERIVVLEQLDRWLRQIEARSLELAALDDTVRQIRQTWRITGDSAAARGAPEAVRERVRAVLATSDSVAREVSQRVPEVLAVLDAVSARRIELREALERIESATRAARTRLFEPDSPPLWKATTGAVADTSLAALVTIAWRARAATVQRFVTSNWPRVGFHFLIFLALLSFVLTLRRAAPPSAASDGSLRAPVHILRHPVAAAALLTLLATGRIYPTVPFPVVSLLIIGGLLIVVWLLRGLVDEWQRAPLYVLSALVLFERERLIAPEGTLLHRVLLLSVTVAAFAAFGWFLVVQRRETERRRGWRVATNLLVRASLVFLGASILANVAGLVMLADVLGSGVIWSAAIALLLATGVLIIQGAIAVGLRTELARRLQVVRRHEQRIVQATGRFLRVFAALWWTILALVAFAALGPVRSAFGGFLVRPRSVGSLEFRVGDWLLFAVTLWAAVWLSRLVRYVLDEDVLPRLALQRGIASLVAALTRYSLLGLGVVVALAVAGIEVSRLAFVAGALGVGIGFGLQNIVSNFVSGLVLLFERPIQAGDTIEVEQLFGVVKRIGVRSSTVRTFQGADVIVPNASLISTNVVNWTLSDRLRRIEIDVGVAYGSDPAQVQDLLLEVASSHAAVLGDPEPVALFQGFGESSLDFSLRCWTSDFDRFHAIRSEIRVGIYGALATAGIEIPFPQRDLHVKSVAPQAGATLTHQVREG